jgi:succinate dehydrogenase / fumarate reductase, cytochrome b subunit
MTETSNTLKKPIERPLSPHLQVYRFSWTMAMSILHRITGGALYLGTLLIAFWLMASASGREGFAMAQAVAGSWIGQLILFGYSWALIHHMIGGLRHFIWDLGKGYGLEARMGLAKFGLLASIGLTILVWIAAFTFG